MLRKKGFHHKIEVWSGCLKQTCFFSLSYTNGPSSVSHRPHLQTWIHVSLKPVGQSWSNLCVASLGWGKGCIRFWGRLDQNSGFHGNRNPHWLIMVTRTCIKSRTSSNFCQIGPLTMELYALERSHWLWMGKMMSPSFLSYYEFRLNQTYRKWGQA